MVRSFSTLVLMATSLSYAVAVQQSLSANLQLSLRHHAALKLEDKGHLVAAHGDGVWLHTEESKEKGKPAQIKAKVKYGFYLHTFDKPEACINLLRNVRKFYPTEPIYIMSDGGMDFKGLCQVLGNCKFEWRPPANDRWNPLPFFNRMQEAAKWLSAEYVVMLEPDNEIRGKIASDPPEDAGGLKDSNPPFGNAFLQYLNEKGRPYSHHKNFSIDWNRFGLAGGSYFRTEAIMKSFKPKDMPWKELRKRVGKKIWSSDVAMPMALAIHGYIYKPWEEVTQVRSEDYWGKPKNHPAFRHYGRDEVKPFYEHSFMSKEDALLVLPIPLNTGSVNCQGCVWVDDSVCRKTSPVQCPNITHDAGPPF